MNLKEGVYDVTCAVDRWMEGGVIGARETEKATLAFKQSHTTSA